MLQYLLMDLTSGCGFLCPPGRRGLGSVLGRLSLGRKDPRCPAVLTPGRAPELPCGAGRVHWRRERPVFAQALPSARIPCPPPLLSRSPSPPRVFPSPSTIRQIFIEHQLPVGPCIPFLVGCNPVGGRAMLIEKLIEHITSRRDNCYKKNKGGPEGRSDGGCCSFS